METANLSEEPEEIVSLQNPNVKRKPIVEQCLSAMVFEDEKDPKKNIYRPDCDKIYTHTNGEQVCRAYTNPTRNWKLGCPLASNKINIKMEKRKIRVGQQKTKSFKFR